MARKVELHCDVCRNPTDKIVGKLFFTAVVPGTPGGAVHSNYSQHADVGECCQSKLLRGFNFRKRQTSAEYQASRRRVA